MLMIFLIFMLFIIFHDKKFTKSCNLTTFTTSFQALTVVRHCGYIPSPLIPGLHDFDALVKALPIFFTQVCLEIVQVCM